jgi:N-acyl-D-amino-acid deacylase
MSQRILIRNGLVIDGSGSRPRRADVLTEGGQIAAVGNLPDAGDFRIINARGLITAPGFVDLHSHGDYTLLVDGRAESALMQGVTTVIVGNCGYGCFPVHDMAVARQSIYGYDGTVTGQFAGIADYGRALAQSRPAINVHTLTPNGQLRVMTDSAESQAAAARRRRLLDDSLDAGSLGYSVGLEYPIEVSTSEAEMRLLCSDVAAHHGLFSVHTRARVTGSAAAVREAVRVAQSSGVRLQVSHLASRGGQSETDACVSEVDAAIRNGVDVSFDMHTRLFGTLNLSALLPGQFMKYGADTQRRLLRTASARQALARQVPPILSSVDWASVLLVDDGHAEADPEASFADLAAARKLAPLDLAYELLADHAERATPLMIMIVCYSPEQLRQVFLHPQCMPASDATILCLDGPLASHVFHGAYTWAGWYWDYMVTQTGSLTAQEAILRMTSLPAATARLPGRGRLEPGFAADVVTFEPAGFRSTGSRDHPNVVAAGIRHVLVNGGLAVADGRLTSFRGGQILFAAS